LHAEINDPTHLAIAPDGSLFFVQQGVEKADEFGGLTNSVIREIPPRGIIRTLAGLHPDCGTTKTSAASIAAQSALFYGANLSIGPAGLLDVAATVCPNVANLGPFLELSRAGQLIKSPLDSIAEAAVNCQNGVEGAGFTAFTCASGGGMTKYPHPQELLVVRRDNTFFGYPTIGEDGGLVTSGDGEVFAVHNKSVVRVTSAGIITIIPEVQIDRLIPNSRSVAAINGIAIGRGGAIFLTPNLYLARGCGNVIAELTTGGELKTLWRSSASRACG
jgi:hypothetical protein